MSFASIFSFVSAWPMDWVILGAVAAVGAFDAVRAGSRNVASLTLAAPLALLAFTQLAEAALLGSTLKQITTPYAGAVMFAVLLIIFFVFIHRMLGLWSDDACGPIQALIAGIACAGVLAVVWVQVPALEVIWHFGPQVQAVFGAAYRLWWLLAAYAALAYVRS